MNKFVFFAFHYTCGLKKKLVTLSSNKGWSKWMKSKNLRRKFFLSKFKMKIIFAILRVWWSLCRKNSQKILSEKRLVRKFFSNQQLN